MRPVFAAFASLAMLLPGSAEAADYLYTFSGVVTYASNFDATYINVQQSAPIEFSLRLSDSSPDVMYSYGATSSTAFGGPDFVPGTLFPIDRKVTVDPAFGYANDFIPLENGYRNDDNYSGSVFKDVASKSLTITMFFEHDEPPYDGCTERCSGSRETHSASAQVFSDAFSSSDFREAGSFALKPGSTGGLGDGFSTFLSFGDSYDIDLSRLMVQRLPSAVPEPGSWLMMVGGLGLVGGSLRRRRKSSIKATFA